MDIYLEPHFSGYFKSYPLILVDIGASDGLPPHWKMAEKHLKVIGFEPNQAAYEALVRTAGSTNRIFFNTALYRERTTVDLYITRRPQVSSLFKPNLNFVRNFPELEMYDILNTVRLETDTLDHQFSLNGIQDADFIKIDTQGSELPILQGARDCLEQHVFAIEAEAEFAPIYQGQPLFSDLETFLRPFGYQVFDLAPCYWKRKAGKHLGNTKGQLIFANVLFIRTPESFDSIVNRIPLPEARVSKVLRALAICLLYGYVDYAWELYQRFRSLFPREEADILEKSIIAMVHLNTRIPLFRGRGRLAAAFYWLWQTFRPLLSGWATPEPKLGNR